MLQKSWQQDSLLRRPAVRTANIMDDQEQAIIDFALTWQPFGGPGSEELMVTFGLTSSQFRARVCAILSARGTRSDQPIRQHARHVLRSYLPQTHQLLPPYRPLGPSGARPSSRGSASSIEACG